MTSATRGEKVYFALIFLSAVWIGLVGFFLPTQLAAIFTWMVLPPLHAQFLGALYLFGALFMLGSLLANRWTQIGTALVAAAIWTGLIFVVSVLNLGAFDLRQFAAWAWLVSYCIYPLLALWLAWTRARRPRLAARPGDVLAGWVRGYLLAQGGLVIVLAVALLVAPAVMAPLWPWKVTATLAQFYSGPLLAYGYSSVQFARAGTWADLRALLPGMLVFTAGALLASLLRSALFSPGHLGAWLWFGGLIVATACLGTITLSGLLRPGTPARHPAAEQPGRPPVGL